MTSKRVLFLAALVIALLAACSSTPTVETAATLPPTTVLNDDRNGTTTAAPSTSTTAPATTTTSAPKATVSTTSPTTAAPLTTTTQQTGPYVDPGMPCSVFVTLQPVDRDRIVAKLAFERKMDPAPDGDTISAACQIRLSGTVTMVLDCFAAGTEPDKFCPVSDAIS